MKRIFLVGVPGSKWSSIAQQIEKVPGINLTDRTNVRSYIQENFTGHTGHYFGKQMEFEPILTEENLNSPYSEPSNGIMLAKSHDWSYNLGEVWEYAKSQNDELMIVWRDPLAAFSWWIEAGGFNITYPTYINYKNEKKMLKEIHKQNSMILDFIKNHNLILEEFNKDFIKKHFNTDLDVNTDSDIRVCYLPAKNKV